MLSYITRQLFAFFSYLDRSRLFRKMRISYRTLFNVRPVFYLLFFVLCVAMIFCRVYYNDGTIFEEPQNIPIQFLEKGNANVDQLRYEAFQYERQSIHWADQLMSKKTAFYFFFILDFLFPLLLFICISVSSYLRRFNAYILFIIWLFVLILDWSENALFMFSSIDVNALSIIQIIKQIAYAVFFIFWLRILWLKYFAKNIMNITKSLLCNLPSILIILTLVGLLIGMGQGTSLVIYTLSNKFSFLFFFILISFLSFILSHYTRFIKQFLFPDPRYEWLNEKSVVFFNVNDDLAPGERQEDITFYSGHKAVDQYIYSLKYCNDNIRHYLGTIMYLSIIFILFHTLFKVFYNVPAVYALSLALIFSAMVIIVQSYFKKLKLIHRKSFSKLFYRKFWSVEDAKLYRHARNIKMEDKEFEEYFKKENVFWLRFFFILYIVIFFGQITVMAVRFIYFDKWNIWNLLFAILQFSMALYSYIFFRECRSLFKYFLGLTSTYKYKIEFGKTLYEEPLIDDDEYVGLHDGENMDKKGISWIFNYLGNFSNNIFYTKWSMRTSLIVSVVIIAFSLFNAIITQVNGVIYIISYIIVYYGLVIFLLKWFFYIKKNEKPFGLFGFKISKNVYNFILIALVLSFIGRFIGNDLHMLDPIPARWSETDSEQLKQDAFIKSIPRTSKNDSLFSSYFAVASFGGGLKANYYTLNLLEKLQQKTNGEFLNSTLSLSGVSGGGVGLSNYALIHDMDESNRKDKIDKIGDLDIVSIDCSFLMFNDFMRASIPLTNFELGDRSTRGMKEYVETIYSREDRNILDTVPYQRIYLDQLKENGYFPNLIMNTTSTKLEYGVAQFVNKVEMPGAVNILERLEIKGPKNTVNNTLNYFDAVSTVNRFPIFSPAAHIYKKGHFVDGGYFENSGLLSTITFLDRLNNGQWSMHEKMELDGQAPRKVVVLSFINSKQHWINYRIKNTFNDSLYVETIDSDNASQFGSIVQTLVGTEMLPNYFIQQLDQKSQDEDFVFIPIYMPYFLQYNEIKQHVNGDIRNWEQVNDMIEKNNQEIIRSLQEQSKLPGKEKYKSDSWGLVEPSLARKLSKPDKYYQNAMINFHPYINKQVKKVLENMYD